MQELLRLLCSELAEGRTAAMATVVFQEGSAPRGAGSRLLAGPSGLIGGTTGGGLAEARVIEACRNACETQEAGVLDIAMDGTLAARSEMICGGQVRVLIEPFAPDRESLIRTASLALNAAEGAGCRIVRPYPSSRTAWTLLYDDGSADGAPLTEDVKTALLAAPLDEAALVPCGGTTYFCERCQPPERMIIVGGGHVSRPTAAIAGLTGFAVHVLDDRPEYANRARFPNAEVHVTPEYADCFGPLRVTPRDYIVIVTRGHLFDGVAAAQALRTPAHYIGMIGSTRKRRQIYAKLLESGFTEQDLARIHAPIGLDIGAETPEEIAVSILAECIAVRRHAPAPVSWRKN
ncbi:XdhC family protein [uncultured Mailhella sp.]|uniref:XdhC family protein n=1 Tax=uncultured Mailhella sp. TaxID=1981031 RepID=UPI0025E719A5|nr:XdhC/CoxI family protein [uncultured Mailhella sp.]